MTEGDARFVETVINGRSAFIVVEATSAVTPGDATVDLDADDARRRRHRARSRGSRVPHRAAARTSVSDAITDRIDLFNLVCVPGLTDGATIQTLQGHCRARRAFLIVDAPDTETVATMPAASTNLTGTDADQRGDLFPVGARARSAAGERACARSRRAASSPASSRAPTRARRVEGAGRHRRQR